MIPVTESTGELPSTGCLGYFQQLARVRGSGFTLQSPGTWQSRITFSVTSGVRTGIELSAHRREDRYPRQPGKRLADKVPQREPIAGDNASKYGVFQALISGGRNIPSLPSPLPPATISLITNYHHVPRGFTLAQRLADVE